MFSDSIRWDDRRDPGHPAQTAVGRVVRPGRALATGIDRLRAGGVIGARASHGTAEGQSDENDGAGMGLHVVFRLGIGLSDASIMAMVHCKVGDNPQIRQLATRILS